MLPGVHLVKLKLNSILQYNIAENPKSYVTSYDNLFPIDCTKMTDKLGKFNFFYLFINISACMINVKGEKEITVFNCLLLVLYQ